MYFKFVDRGPSWKQIAAGKGSRPKKVDPGQVLQRHHPAGRGGDPTPVVPVAHTPAPRVPVEDENNVTVPVPLSRDGGRKATLILPIGLSDKEAKKIAGIVELYVMPEQLAIATGEPTE